MIGKKSEAKALHAKLNEQLELEARAREEELIRERERQERLETAKRAEEAARAQRGELKHIAIIPSEEVIRPVESENAKPSPAVEFLNQLLDEEDEIYGTRPAPLFTRSRDLPPQTDSNAVSSAPATEAEREPAGEVQTLSDAPETASEPVADDPLSTDGETAKDTTARPEEAGDKEYEKNETTTPKSESPATEAATTHEEKTNIEEEVVTETEVITAYREVVVIPSLEEEIIPSAPIIDRPLRKAIDENEPDALDEPVDVPQVVSSPCPANETEVERLRRDCNAANEAAAKAEQIFLNSLTSEDAVDEPADTDLDGDELASTSTSILREALTNAFGAEMAAKIMLLPPRPQLLRALANLVSRMLVQGQWHPHPHPHNYAHNETGTNDNGSTEEAVINPEDFEEPSPKPVLDIRVFKSLSDSVPLLSEFSSDPENMQRLNMRKPISSANGQHDALEYFASLISAMHYNLLLHQLMNRAIKSYKLRDSSQPNAVEIPRLPPSLTPRALIANVTMKSSVPLIDCLPDLIIYMIKHQAQDFSVPMKLTLKDLPGMQALIAQLTKDCWKEHLERRGESIFTKRYFGIRYSLSLIDSRQHSLSSVVQSLYDVAAYLASKSGGASSPQTEDAQSESDSILSASLQDLLSRTLPTLQVTCETFQFVNAPIRPVLARKRAAATAAGVFSATAAPPTPTTPKSPELPQAAPKLEGGVQSQEAQANADAEATPTENSSNDGEDTVEGSPAGATNGVLSSSESQNQENQEESDETTPMTEPVYLTPTDYKVMCDPDEFMEEVLPFDIRLVLAPFAPFIRLLVPRPPRPSTHSENPVESATEVAAPLSESSTSPVDGKEAVSATDVPSTVPTEKPMNSAESPDPSQVVDQSEEKVASEETSENGKEEGSLSQAESMPSEPAQVSECNETPSESPKPAYPSWASWFGFGSPSSDSTDTPTSTEKHATEAVATSLSASSVTSLEVTTTQGSGENSREVPTTDERAASSKKQPLLSSETYVTLGESLGAFFVRAQVPETTSRTNVLPSMAIDDSDEGALDLDISSSLEHLIDLIRKQQDVDIIKQAEIVVAEIFVTLRTPLRDLFHSTSAESSQCGPIALRKMSPEECATALSLVTASLRSRWSIASSPVRPAQIREPNFESSSRPLLDAICQAAGLRIPPEFQTIQRQRVTRTVPTSLKFPLLNGISRPPEVCLIRIDRTSARALAGVISQNEESDASEDAADGRGFTSRVLQLLGLSSTGVTKCAAPCIFPLRTSTLSHPFIPDFTPDARFNDSLSRVPYLANESSAIVSNFIQDSRAAISAVHQRLAETDYALRAFISHIGPTTASGHYISAIQSQFDNIWYQVDDASRKPIFLHTSALASQDVYILVYVRERRILPKFLEYRV